MPAPADSSGMVDGRAEGCKTALGRGVVRAGTETEGTNRERLRGTLASAKRGDEEAFARIWRAFQPGLLRYLRVKAATVSEDLAADTWVRVIRGLPTFEGDEDGFRAWLYTTARNRVTDWYRGRDRRPVPSEIATITVLPASNDVEAEAAEHASTEIALGLIDRLPPDQAEAVMLRVVIGLDPASVGRMMGRTPVRSACSVTADCADWRVC